MVSLAKSQQTLEPWMKFVTQPTANSPARDRGFMATAATCLSMLLFLAACSAEEEKQVVSTRQPAVSVALERGDVENIVREYLLANPELLLEVQDALETKQRAEQRVAQGRALSERADDIFLSTHQFSIGNPDAPVTVVEFFDYNCGFCKRALDDMAKLVDSSGQVRFILKEFPVLGEASLAAHRVSLAFGKLAPEKYNAFHRELLSQRGSKGREQALDLALSMGADETLLLAEMEKPYIAEAIREVYGIADDLGISGTPSYVLGDEVVFGAVGYDTLKSKIDNVRDCGSTECT